MLQSTIGGGAGQKMQTNVVKPTGRKIIENRHYYLLEKDSQSHWVGYTTLTLIFTNLTPLEV